MISQEIREKFLSFFKDRGHKIVPSSSLIPADPSVLLTTAGMQQFKPYFTGEKDSEKDFGSLRAASIQKCFRTSDIDEVGDESHLTFFEMLGNFSFGPVGPDDPKDFGKTGYFKRSAIFWAHEFITKELGLTIDYVTIFGGSTGSPQAGQNIPYDEESEKIWQELGVGDIHTAGMEDNFWGPTGGEGPCGPTTEIYVGGIEIWNIVFNEYYCHSDGSLTKLGNPGVDTGMGLERLAMVLQKKNNVFETDLLTPIMKLFSGSEEITGIELKDERIIADHGRAIIFLISDGVRPSNKGRDYILRRLIRRVIVRTAQLAPLLERQLQKKHISYQEASVFYFKNIFKIMVENYKKIYAELNLEVILAVFEKENETFQVALESGLREFNKLKNITAADLFKLKQSNGLDFEILKIIAPERTKHISKEDFDEEFKKHQEISRAGAEKKFGGHGFKEGEGSEKITRLHTATHLLQASLKKILGPEVSQRGSDITEERTRFDFNFPRKLAPEELKQIEEFVNDVIKKDLNVIMEEMAYEEAIKKNAVYVLGAKYPPQVTVYSIIDSSSGEVVSREICGGPHISHTAEIGEFRIIKEESVAEGVRRIRAVIE